MFGLWKRLRRTVINVNSLAFIRYANIFKRKAKPDFPRPVAIVTDADVAPDAEDGATKGDKVALAAATAMKAANYDGQCVKSFVSPQWTLEYCLSKSAAFGAKFQEIAKAVHGGTKWTDFDADLADKLKKQSLKKTEIANRLAQAIAKGEIDKSKVAGDKHIEYLVKAIEYACGI
jgi:putative ATP-dependent endonuclease of OLD family